MLSKFRQVPSSDKYIITCGRKFFLSMAHRAKPAQHIAESEKKNEEQEQEEEEYVLLDFGSDFSQCTFPPNIPYTLSGLDTLNPILTIGDGLKLRGEYEETIGSCLIFSESAEEYSIAHEETGPSDANLFAGKCIVDPNQAPRKQIKNVCQLHKVLKFKVVSDETTDKKNNDDNINQGQ